MSTPMEELCNVPPLCGKRSGPGRKDLRNHILDRFPNNVDARIAYNYASNAMRAKGRHPVVISEAAYALLQQRLNERLLEAPITWLLAIHEKTLSGGMHYGGWFYFVPLSWDNEKGFFGDVIEGPGVMTNPGRKPELKYPWSDMSRPMHEYVVRLWKFADWFFPAGFNDGWKTRPELQPDEQQRLLAIVSRDTQEERDRRARDQQRYAMYALERQRRRESVATAGL